MNPNLHALKEMLNNLQDKLLILPIVDNLEQAAVRSSPEVRICVELYLQKQRQEIDDTMDQIKNINEIIHNIEIIEQFNAMSLNEHSAPAEDLSATQDEVEQEGDLSAQEDLSEEEDLSETLSAQEDMTAQEGSVQEGSVQEASAQEASAQEASAQDSAQDSAQETSTLPDEQDENNYEHHNEYQPPLGERLRRLLVDANVPIKRGRGRPKKIVEATVAATNMAAFIDST